MPGGLILNTDLTECREVRMFTSELDKERQDCLSTKASIVISQVFFKETLLGPA